MIAVNLRTGEAVKGEGFHCPEQLIGYLHYLHDSPLPQAKAWSLLEECTDRAKGERASWEDWEPGVQRTGRGIALGDWTVRTDGKPPALQHCIVQVIQWGGNGDAPEA